MVYGMREILEAYKSGKITAEEAERRINRRLLDMDGAAFFDLWRRARTGVPEVVMGGGKGLEDLVRICTDAVEEEGIVIVSRLGADKARVLMAELSGFEMEYSEKGRVLAVYRMRPEKSGVRVAVLSAGTADIPVAEEARFLLEHLGDEVYTKYDIGIAGLHRVYKAIREADEFGAMCYIVAAGMEGALPSVVAGLVSVPVIGVPTSVGYGNMGGGSGALGTMLQSCTPVVVVNVDNGVGAGLVAHKIGMLSQGGDSTWQRQRK